MLKITVKENEKVFLYEDEKLIKILDLGVYKWFSPFKNYRIEVYNMALAGLEIEKSKRLCLLYPKIVEQYFTKVQTNQNQRAYLFENNTFVEFLFPNTTKLYWKENNIRAKIVDVKEAYEVAKEDTPYVKNLIQGLEKVIVKKNEKGYLYKDEVFVKELDAGKYYYYTTFYSIEVKQIDNRIKELEINNQELLTKDKVTLRCNLTMHYKIEDGLKYLNDVNLPIEYLYKQLQFSLREYLGALNIDEVLTSQHTLSQEILEKLYGVCEKIGIKVEGVHIKDIILPGEMRDIFNQVIEASKRAEANNIQRREETASTRSLLNTAKLMNDNPALIRLKELEALEKITQTIGTLNVYGGLEGVMHGLVDLKGKV